MKKQNKRRVPKGNVPMGAIVTCLEKEEAYGSKYAGLPECWFHPGMEGQAVGVDLPCVTYAYRRKGGTASFVCVEFQALNRTWRCGLYYNNIKVLRGPSQQGPLVETPEESQEARPPS